MLEFASAKQVENMQSTWLFEIIVHSGIGIRYSLHLVDYQVNLSVRFDAIRLRWPH